MDETGAVAPVEVEDETDAVTPAVDVANEAVPVIQKGDVPMPNSSGKCAVIVTT